MESRGRQAGSSVWGKSGFFTASFPHPNLEHREARGGAKKERKGGRRKGEGGKGKEERGGQESLLWMLLLFKNKSLVLGHHPSLCSPGCPLCNLGPGAFASSENEHCNKRRNLSLASFGEQSR